MAEQLLLDGERKTNEREISIARGNEKELEFGHDLGPAASIQEARFAVLDSTSTAVLILTLEEHPTQWDFTTDDLGVLTFLTGDTKALTVGAIYTYVLNFVDLNDKPYTVLYGDFVVLPGIEDDGASSAYSTLSTRATLDALIDSYYALVNGMMNTTNFSALGAAASATDTSITVETGDGDLFSGTPTIRIMLDDGTYDERTVTGEVADVVSFSGGGLSDDAAEGNIVRIV